MREIRLQQGAGYSLRPLPCRDGCIILSAVGTVSGVGEAKLIPNRFMGNPAKVVHLNTSPVALTACPATISDIEDPGLTVGVLCIMRSFGSACKLFRLD